MQFSYRSKQQPARRAPQRRFARSPRTVRRALGMEPLESRALLAVVNLVTETTPSKGIVVTQAIYDDVGTDWNGSDPSFDDTTWVGSAVGGPNGIGAPITTGGKYANFASISSAAMAFATNTSFLRIPFQVSGASAFSKLTLNMRFDDGFIAYLNGQEVARQNVAPDYPAWNAPATAFISPADASATFTTFDVSSSVGALQDGTNILAIRGFDRPQVGNFPSSQDFLVQATLVGEKPDAVITANDDAVSYRTDAADPVINVLANDTAGSYPIDPASVQIVQQPTGGTVTVNANGTIRYSENTNPQFAGVDTFTYRVRDTNPAPTPGGTTTPTPVVGANAAHRRLVPTAAQAATWTGSGTFDDSTWLVGQGGVGYDTDVAVDYEPYIQNGLVTMQNVNASVYARYPFTLADPTKVVGLRLQMRYEDGFVAWINGVEVARGGAPTPALWNSLANGGARNEAMAIAQTEFVVDLAAAGLVLKAGPGANILAIQGLNDTLGSSDLLIQPELIADVGSTGLWSNEATVTVSVTGPGPVAADDFPETINVIEQQDGGVTVDVLANDTPGFSGEPIRPGTVEVTVPPANGSVIVDAATGAINYQPDTGFWGDDVFTYTVRDADMVGGSETRDLIPAGDMWKYLDNGTDQGTAWTGTSFNDASWATGRAELGYGDGDEATIVACVTAGTPCAGNPPNKFITTYFRRTFDLADASAVQSLDVRLEYDDGGIVYINGTEVARVNMPAGAPTYTTPATGAADYARTPTSIAMLTGAQLAPLRDGTNVVAVEIHQGNGTSSDMSFDFQLVANLSTPTGNVSNPAQVHIHVNAPPVAGNDTIQVGPFGTMGSVPSSITFDPYVNDSDPDNSPGQSPGQVGINRTQTLITQQPPPGDGLVSVNPTTGLITYTAQAGMRNPETVTFRYQVFDYQNAHSNEATVTVNLVVTPPTAVDDAVATPEGQTVVINVLANDITRDLLRSDGSIVPTQPANGTVTLNTANNTLVYTPNPGFRDQFDTFTYTVSDLAGNRSAPATVTVDVFSLARTAGDGFSIPTGQDSVTIPIADMLVNDYWPTASFQPVVVIVPNSWTNGLQPVINVVGGVQQSITFTKATGAAGVGGFSYYLADGVPNPTRPNSNTSRVDVALTTVTVSGKVYVDVNQNGTYEFGERLIPDATIVLRRAGNPQFVRTTMTNSFGEYSFASTADGVLPPDTYTITQIQPALYLDFTTGAVNSYTVALSAPENPGFDFREWTVNPQFFVALVSYGGGFLASQQPVSLSAGSIVVPYDVGWNGTFAAKATYNPALGDVSVKLYNSGGALLANSATSGGSTPGNSVINYSASPSQKLVLVVSGTNPNVLVDAPSLATTSGDTTPPFVYSTALASTRWSSGFAENLAEHFMGTGGYNVSAGETLPWQNLDRITMRFTEPVAVTQGDLRLWGVDVADYPQTVGVQSFSYDPLSFTATWTLSAPIAADQLRVGLSDAVRDVWGNRVGGTGYSMLFNVLPGAIPGTGSTAGDAIAAMMSRQFASVGQARYSPFYDLDGSGTINFVDAIALRNALGSQLPLGTPGGGSTSTPSPEAPAAVVVSAGRESDAVRRRDADTPLAASRAVVRATRAAAVDAVVDAAVSADAGAGGGASSLSALRARRAARSAERVLAGLDGSL
ncbi:MAG: hypothetical protein DCC68_07810 [Planctomycetota bacterium]|nr:MAG: hypothetical protein DCC68_07810 [Planctomycetota bacterium]